MTTQRHKMSLSVDYVHDWTVQDALRELFQNSIDHGDWSWNYTGYELTITSHKASLSKKTLLLGHSVKSEGSIGKFGEGYKLAMLVLCRLGYKPYISTSDMEWTPKIIKSRTYDTAQLVFDVEAGFDLSPDIKFTIPGINQETFDELSERNLHIKPACWLQTARGDILAESYAGKVFVGGLYVCTIEGMRHGYNIKPSCISLDRDRRIVRDFDLQWQTSQMWQETEEHDYVLWLIGEKAPDVRHLDCFMYNNKVALADKAAEAFVAEHGIDAVPVTNQSQLVEAQKDGHENIILVEPVTKQLLLKSDNWEEPPPRIVRKTPREILLEYYADDKPVDQALLDLAEGWVAV